MGERLAILETRVDNMEEKLNSIEHKLDSLQKSVYMMIGGLMVLQIIATLVIKIGGIK